MKSHGVSFNLPLCWLLIILDCAGFWKYWIGLGSVIAVKVASAFVATLARVPLAQPEVCGLTMAGSVLVLFYGKERKKLTLPILFRVSTWRHGTHGHVCSLYCRWYATYNAILLYTCNILCGFSIFFVPRHHLLSHLVKGRRKKKWTAKRHAALSFAVNLRVLFGCIFLIYKHALK